MLFLAFHTFLLLVSAFADQVRVKPGEDVVLQCRAASDSPVRLLEWIRPDLKSDGDVFFYRNNRSDDKYQHPSFRGRVELKDPEMKNGDVSVILKNININDAGTYECRISSSTTTSSELKNGVNLEVSDSGLTEATNIWKQVEKDPVINDEENSVNIKLGVGLFFAALFVSVGSVLCFLKFRKGLKRSRQPSYKLPLGRAA